MVLRKESDAKVASASDSENGDALSAVDDKFKRLNLFFEKERVS